MTKLQIHGACHCGAVRYRAMVDPALVTICHCTDCQVLTGTAYRVTVPTALEDFELLSGEPRLYIKTGATGSRRAQGFCAHCGSQLYAHAAENPTSYGLRTGGIAEREALPPRKQKWCDSAQPWAMDIGGLPKTARE